MTLPMILYGLQYVSQLPLFSCKQWSVDLFRRWARRSSIGASISGLAQRWARRSSIGASISGLARRWARRSSIGASISGLARRWARRSSIRASISGLVRRWARAAAAEPQYRAQDSGHDNARVFIFNMRMTALYNVRAFRDLWCLQMILSENLFYSLLYLPISALLSPLERGRDECLVQPHVFILNDLDLKPMEWTVIWE